MLLFSWFESVKFQWFLNSVGSCFVAWLYHPDCFTAINNQYSVKRDLNSDLFMFLFCTELCGVLLYLFFELLPSEIQNEIFLKMMLFHCLYPQSLEEYVLLLVSFSHFDIYSIKMVIPFAKIPSDNTAKSLAIAAQVNKDAITWVWHNTESPVIPRDNKLLWLFPLEGGGLLWCY